MSSKRLWFTASEPRQALERLKGVEKCKDELSTSSMNLGTPC